MEAFRIRTLLYWIPRLIVVLFALVWVVTLFRPPHDLLWNIYGQFPALMFVLPLAGVALVLTTPALSRAVTIWRWVLGVTLAFLALGIGVVLVGVFSRNDALIYPSIPLIVLHAPVLLVESVGLLLAEWLAKRA